MKESLFHYQIYLQEHRKKKNPLNWDIGNKQSQNKLHTKCKTKSQISNSINKEKNREKNQCLVKKKKKEKLMRNEEYLNGRLDWNGCVSDLKEHEHCWIRRERKRKRGKKSWGPENWIQEIQSPWLCNSELHLYKNTLFHRPHLPVTDMQAATSHVHSGDVTDEAAAMWERDTQGNIYVYM